MKSLIIASLLTLGLSASALAADGADRVAEDGFDRTGSHRIAEDGYDRTKGHRIV